MDEREGSVQGGSPLSVPLQAKPGEHDPYLPFLAAYAKGAESSKAVTPGDAEKMAEKMMGGGFSWMTFFFGPLYWAYRRCYKETVLFELCWLALVLAEALLGVRSSVLVINAPAALLFYPLYRKRAMQAYGEAYAAHGRDQEAIMEAMRDAGGVSWGGFMAFFAFETVVLVALFCVALGPVLASYSL